jgi:hypothetical protein
MPTEITILDARRLPSLDPARRGKYDHLVTYQVAPGITHTVTVPDEGFSEQSVKAAIAAAEKQAAGIVGKKFTI